MTTVPITETPEYQAAARDLASRLDEMYEDSSCGGWRDDPPCGGCGDCLRQQAWYGFMLEWGLIT